MNFYIAKIVFGIEVNKESYSRQFEEKLVLIKDLDIKKAYKKALVLGSREESEFVNQNGHLIRWKMEGISHISKLMNISEETEIFSELKDDYSEEQARILKHRIAIISKKFISVS